MLSLDDHLKANESAVDVLAQKIFHVEDQFQTHPVKYKWELHISQRQRMIAVKGYLKQHRQTQHTQEIHQSEHQFVLTD